MQRNQNINFRQVSKSRPVLFNLHRVLALESRQDVVIIVEGVFDCLKVWQVGMHQVVGLMGSSISDEHQKLLTAFKRIIFFWTAIPPVENGVRQLQTSSCIHTLFMSFRFRIEKGESNRISYRQKSCKEQSVRHKSKPRLKRGFFCRAHPGRICQE